MGKTRIEWATHSWQVVTGCLPVSEGCENCYAARMAASRLRDHPRYEGLAGIADGKPRWTGSIRLNRDVLEDPLRWRKPSRIFVAPMGDLFHGAVPDSFLVDVWDVVAECPQHTFLILTKRIERVATGHDPWLPNVWLGVSAENQARLDERVGLLLQVPAARHFVSMEPMLGPVNIAKWLAGSQKFCDWWARGKSSSSLDLVIAGAETGSRARPAELDWFRLARDQCQEAGVPFFLKQVNAKRERKLDGQLWEEWPEEDE